MIKLKNILQIILVAIVVTACGQNKDHNQSKMEVEDKESLSAISPTAEVLKVGYAGEDPTDIARYLLANGASRIALSPDGSTIAFSYAITGKPQLWTISANGGQPQQLTYGNGATFFKWSPDGKTILYGADNDGNEQESYYAISADGSSEQLILPAVKGGFRVFGDFSADGKSFAYASTERNGLDFDIYTTNVESKEGRRVYEGKYGYFVNAVSPDGKTLVLSETVGEDSDNLYIYDVSKSSKKTISKPTPRANHADGGVIWSSEQNALYFASNKNREFSALTKYDISNESLETLFEGDANVRNIKLCGPKEHYLVWTTNHDGFSRLHIRNRLSGKDISPPSLPEGVYQLSCSTNSTKLAIQINGWATPGDIYVWNIETGTQNIAFHSNFAGLSPQRLIRPEVIRLPAQDGVELQGLLYLPDETSRKSDALPPVVFYVHGGPTGQSRPYFNGVIQYHVDRGFAVFQPNVRGSSGFGRTYSTLDDQKKRLDSVRDLIDMLAYLKKDGRVDTNRAAVAGGSYGGYMVNAVLAEYPNSFRAGVSLYGVADWITALEIASPALKASDLIEYGDIKDPVWRQFYEVNSPIRQAHKIKVPVLYSHGEMDPRIDIAETEVMVRSLRANNIDAPFIRIPDEGHGWRKLSNRLFYYRRQVEFLEKHLATK